MTTLSKPKKKKKSLATPVGCGTDWFCGVNCVLPSPHPKCCYPICWWSTPQNTVTYRDWHGWELHLRTWGSGRLAWGQSLSFTRVVVLLTIRVHDTMVLRSPGSQTMGAENLWMHMPRKSFIQVYGGSLGGNY